jgi:hypothetical protein
LNPGWARTQTALPDAAAAVAAAARTSAFKDVQVHEVLTDEQLRDVAALARSTEGVYRPLGQGAIERDI